MRSLNELGAPDVQPGRQDAGDGSDAHRRLELAKWLSDWHLLSFLGTCGLLSEVTNIPPLPFFRVCTMLTRPHLRSHRAMRKFSFVSLLRRIWRMILPYSTRYWRRRVGRPSPPLHAKVPVRHFNYTSFYSAPRVNCRCAYLFFFCYSATTSARRTVDSYHGRRHPARIIR
jgi:hypothetical protein